ncbi:exonuclease [Salmonella enterica subsp. enterica]|nr:exonuclease [Salmonella enterica subsp. enterica]EDU8877904.1 exonuclease [Salmonella enterica subsp. enterica]
MVFSGCSPVISQLCRTLSANEREGIHHVVVERDLQYMSDFNEMVPEFIEKMDEALAEIGFTFGEQWR